jgi:signal transduction histidine kinase/ActR/RegA family two-component response regulator
VTTSGDTARLSALNGVLKVLVRHANLLQPEPFEELAEAVAQIIPFHRIALLVPEGPDHRRVYAMTRGTTRPIAFGGRAASVPAVVRRVYVEQLPFFLDDTREGLEIDRAAAEMGALSYVVFPVRGPDTKGTPRVIAELVLTFGEAFGARRAPVDLLQEVADLLGSTLERAIRLARDRRLAMILKTSGDALLAWDREGRITDANPAALVLTGRPRDELIGTPIIELLAALPDGRGPIELAASTARGLSTELTDRIALAPGVRLDLFARSLGPGRPLRRIVVAATITAVDDDPLVAAHALLRDLSHVVVAENEAAQRLSRIHELEEQHRTLLDNAPLIIFRLDPRTGELVYLNRHAERLLGVPMSEALATPGFLRAAHADPDGAQCFDDAVARARQSDGAISADGDPTRPAAPSLRPPPYEARLLRRNDEAITARGTVYPLLSEGGELVAIEGLLVDVSAEHTARTRLVQNDRLATLGTLAAGVAHEINNPAAFILLGLDMLDRLLNGAGITMEPVAAQGAGELLHELRDSIRRIVDIARDLRLFASPPAADNGRRTVIDVNRTVESALSLTRGQIIERAQLFRRLDEVPPVLMEDGRLAQVVVNLLVNAAQAIPKAYGRDQSITVSTRSDGCTVEIEVRDSGVGIPPEVLSRIWQPFFTTKSAEAGTGLGLSISREIVERAGGQIWAESPPPPAEGDDPARPISGARFVISLPAAGRNEVITPITSPLPRTLSARVRVLVVEDEPSLARALGDELGRLHQVTVVSCAMDALTAIEGQSFDVILCDLRMPGMSGEAFYTRVAQIDPAHARRFIFMTGVGFGADVERFLAAAGRPVLEKPFSADDALEAIVKVVNRNNAAKR